ASLEQTIAELSDRLEAARRAPGGLGRGALDRDVEGHQLTGRLRALRRFGADLCLGHIVGADDGEPVYIGRLGLTDSTGRRLLLDWRAPAAEPFFAATHANPMGLASRRRYRWTRGRIGDYWDEVFTADGLEGRAALDDQSAFIASLGEEGVKTCTLRDLVPEGATAGAEPDPEVARLKSSAQMVKAIEKAVGIYEEPPTEGMAVETYWDDLWLSADDWAEAFSAPEPGTPHNEAREQIWEELVTILLDKMDVTEEDEDEGGFSPAMFRRSLRQNKELVTTLNRAWPMLDATDLVGDLWTVPAYLRLCAPWLAPEDVKRLQRADAQAWTVSDLPLLDGARRRLGDREAAVRKRRHDAALAAERARMADVIDHILEADEDGEGAVT
ncbi:hypothetical protein AB0O00_40640, partial [Kitasatospora sp. NPDC093558]